jgi:DNA-binding transcriptional MerR regulator
MSNGARNAAPCGAAAADDSAAAQSHVLSIAVVARMFKIAPLALRLYEWRGLIRRKRAGNERTYSWADCERIALLVKARKAGIATGKLVPVIKAMDDAAPKQTTDAGRRQCLAVIHTLEAHQASIGNVLAELHRIDWELADRLGVKQAHKSVAASGRS